MCLVLTVIRLEYHRTEPDFSVCRAAQKRDRNLLRETSFLSYAVLMLSIAIRKRVRVFALAIVTLFAVRAALCDDATARDSVSLAPESLSNGAPCLIMVTLHVAASTVTGTWQGHPVVFFAKSDRRTWFALAGVDVEVHPGNYPLTIEATLKDGTHRTLHKDVVVEEAPYEKVPLTVPDKFVEPNAAALKKIAADKIVKDKAFAKSVAVRPPQMAGAAGPKEPIHE